MRIRRARELLQAMRSGTEAQRAAPSALVGEELTDRVGLVVAQAFRDVLAVEPTDLRASLADLGGDSLLAVRILARCSRELGVDLPLRLLERQTTLGEFVAAARSRVETNGVSDR
ncbi:acyl carrier protein [Actinoalloteichus hoggarensis]|uniref:Peptide synthase n=1 Tax=Actinoalloteichus hoggarensis TaxID=1470176 RepID=A0A221W478_9PSEU|nr:acyl carrier protein [Actinoalloteichus hoggarensis]ASO20692.1 peptide synthase [Actinoalloteichus hoggarensis]MBB5924455.1 acyl carrier protein [Actinoalloteichus hoggarensis]